MTDRKGIFMESIFYNGDIVIVPVFKRGAYWKDTFVMFKDRSGYVNIWVDEQQKNKVAPNTFTKWSN